MAFERRSLTLAGDAPGTSTELIWYVAGPADAATKVYLQAALHADEHPGTMALHHLLPMLRRADDTGGLNARFTVLPAANPLGLQARSFDHHLGRYDPRTGINHNRRWPDLYPLVRGRIAGRLTDDAAANVALIRRAVAQWLDEQRPRTAIDQLRLAILREAHDADIMLDLHCDSESLPYIYTSPELMPGLQDLSDWVGAVATLVAADSGGGSFDEVLPQLFRKAAADNPGKPIPMAAATATVEYRGQADVFDAIGADDARRLWGFLCGRGLVAGEAGEPPAPMPPAIPFEATEIVRTERPGLIAYRVELGERVTKGQPIADLIALDGPEAFMARTPILAGTDGLMLSRAAAKYAPAGTGIAKIVGSEVLPGRRGAYLLED